MVVVKSDIKNKDCVQNIDGGFGGRSPPKKNTVLACKFLVPTHDSIYVSAILSEKIILSRGGGLLTLFSKSEIFSYLGGGLFTRGFLLSNPM